MERRIIHLNIADFCVAVERLLDTGLRGQPLIIAVGIIGATVMPHAIFLHSSLTQSRPVSTAMYARSYVAEDSDFQPEAQGVMT